MSPESEIANLDSRPVDFLAISIKAFWFRSCDALHFACARGPIQRCMAPTTHMCAVPSYTGDTWKSLVTLPAKYSVKTTVRGRRHPLTVAALLGPSWHSSSSCKSRSHIQKRVVIRRSSDRDSGRMSHPHSVHSVGGFHAT